jgi:hypothetical protein
MPKQYFVLFKPSGAKCQVDPSRVDAFFDTLKEVTGIDRAVAEPQLLSGETIDRHDFAFSVEEVAAKNPFTPTKIAL